MNVMNFEILVPICFVCVIRRKGAKLSSKTDVVYNTRR